MNKNKTFHLVMILIFAFSMFGTPSPVLAQESQVGVKANPGTDAIEAWGWEEGTPITLTIAGSDFSITQPIEPIPWDPNQLAVEFQLKGLFDLIPGQVITVTGNSLSKTMTIADISNVSVDPEADIVSGYVSPRTASVHVGINSVGGSDTGQLYIDENGYWIANFRIRDVDILPGAAGYVQADSQDGGTTWIDFRLPYIDAFPYRDMVRANDWPLDTVITLTINDSYLDTATMGQASWNPNEILVEFGLREFDLKVGDHISITGAGMTRSMTVSTLQVNNVDVLTSTVSGTGDIGKNVDIWMNGGEHLNPPLGTGGAWTAHFTNPPLGPGSNGYVRQIDDAGNYTWDYWNVRTPSLEIDVTTNSAYTSDWLVGTDVTISFDDPGNGTGWDYSKTVEVPPGWGGWCQFIINIDPTVFRIQAGQVVKITDGVTTRQSTIPLLTVEVVDQVADTISGYTRAAGTVNVQAYYMTRPGGGTRNPVANGAGYWVADFAQSGAGNEWETFDIDGSQGFFWISIPGDDYVSAKFQWGLGPVFNVFPENAQVTTSGWPYNVDLILTIDDPSTGVGPDQTRTQMAQEGNMGWGSEATFENLDAILPGFIVSITDGTVTKTHTVTPLAVTGINPAADTISGTSSQNAEVHVWSDDGSERVTIADPSGNWTADFSVEQNGQPAINLINGSTGNVWMADDDGDTTNIRWHVPNPVFSVLPDDNSMEGNDWPLDSTVTIKIGDLDNPDYSTTTSVNPPDQDHSQTWFKLEFANIFDLQPGQIVTVSDTKTTKQTIIVPRNITLIDLATDTIAGEAEPNIVNVVLWACDDNGCGARYKDVNPDGSWSVNFAEPGEQVWENVIVDIQPDTTGGIYQGDADGDGTTYLEWSVRNQMPVANAGPDRIVYAGEMITLDASASSDPEAGALTYAWDLDNDGEYDDATSVTATASFNQPGVHTIGLQVTDDGGLTGTDTVTITVLAWTLKGFYQPVDMNGVYNTVKNGSTVPLKFEIFAGSTELTDLTYIKSLTYALTTCNADVTTDEIELTATGDTSLRYDAASGQFIYNWKTPKTSGKCYRVTLVTFDGSVLLAYFKLK